jgi:hypothetical protein
MNGKSAKVKDVSTDDGALTLWLDDGRVVGVPLSWFPSLVEASPKERNTWRRSGAGSGIHWVALDYDLSVEGILAGHHEHPNALRYTRDFRRKQKVQGKASRHLKPGRKVPV